MSRDDDIKGLVKTYLKYTVANGDYYRFIEHLTLDDIVKSEINGTPKIGKLFIERIVSKDKPKENDNDNNSERSDIAHFLVDELPFDAGFTEEEHQHDIAVIEDTFSDLMESRVRDKKSQEIQNLDAHRLQSLSPPEKGFKVEYPDNPENNYTVNITKIQDSKYASKNVVDAKKWIEQLKRSTEEVKITFDNQVKAHRFLQLLIRNRTNLDLRPLLPYIECKNNPLKAEATDPLSFIMPVELYDILVDLLDEIRKTEASRTNEFLLKSSTVSNDPRAAYVYQKLREIFYNPLYLQYLLDELKTNDTVLQEYLDLYWKPQFSEDEWKSMTPNDIAAMKVISFIDNSDDVYSDVSLPFDELKEEVDYDEKRVRAQLAILIKNGSFSNELAHEQARNDIEIEAGKRDAKKPKERAKEAQAVLTKEQIIQDKREKAYMRLGILPRGNRKAWLEQLAQDERKFEIWTDAEWELQEKSLNFVRKEEQRQEPPVSPKPARPATPPPVARPATPPPVARPASPPPVARPASPPPVARPVSPPPVARPASPPPVARPASPPPVARPASPPPVARPASPPPVARPASPPPAARPATIKRFSKAPPSPAGAPTPPPAAGASPLKRFSKAQSPAAGGPTPPPAGGPTPPPAGGPTPPPAGKTKRFNK